MLGVRSRAASLWSNALAYQEVNLAPRDRLAELEQIGDALRRRGPDPDDRVRALRRPPLPAPGAIPRERPSCAAASIPLRNGRAARQARGRRHRRVRARRPAGRTARWCCAARRSRAARRLHIQARPQRAAYYDVWQRAELRAGDRRAPAARRRRRTRRRPRRARASCGSRRGARAPDGRLAAPRGGPTPCRQTWLQRHRPGPAWRPCRAAPGGVYPRRRTRSTTLVHGARAPGATTSGSAGSFRGSCASLIDGTRGRDPAARAEPLGPVRAARVTADSRAAGTGRARVRKARPAPRERRSRRSPRAARSRAGLGAGRRVRTCRPRARVAVRTGARLDRGASRSEQRRGPGQVPALAALLLDPPAL